MPTLRLSFESGEQSLSVRAFSVYEAISMPFQVSVVALSPSATVDLEAIVGKKASLHVESGVQHVTRWGRHWSGVVSNIEFVQPEVSDKGLSTYTFTIVPVVWLLHQRRGYRIFQHIAIPDIIDKLLSEWKIEPVWNIDRGAYPKLEYKVQYGESDFAFFSRLLEEAGIAYHFPETQELGSRLLLDDHLTSGKLHPASPIVYTDEPNQSSQKEFVSDVLLSHGVRPGAFTLRDHDFRKPLFSLIGEATKSPAPENLYEQYHYLSGSALAEGGAGGGTPMADNRGIARHEEKTGKDRAERSLTSIRADKRIVAFSTNVFGLAPTNLFTMEHHPHPELDTGARLLITEMRTEGSASGEWVMNGKAAFAKTPYFPPLITPKPEVKGVESAIVVGPPGEEIHVDEFGRVRVQFPWDREGKYDDGSSCWMRVSQGWAGTGFGALNLPRVGQEVLVTFLGGDPDRPIVVGRVFNGQAQVPYKLPENKTRSTWKSDSSPGGNGFNEILFEDAKDKELVFMQAQKNQRRLVKNDETITVGNDRQKLVKRNELETTNGTRTEVTVGDRTEITRSNRIYAVDQSLSKLVRGDETEQTNGNHKLLISGAQDLIVRADKKEHVGGDSHLGVVGDSLRMVGGKDSTIVEGSQHAKVATSHALNAGTSIHLKAGTSVVIEGAIDVTLKGAGGFVRVHPGGVMIVGTLVTINSGGAPGMAPGASPSSAATAAEAKVPEPPAPEPDDVSVTRLGQ